MAITVTRKTSWFTGYLAIPLRLNKKYVRDIDNKETVILDLPTESSSLSINWIHLPKMMVQDGDQIMIRNSRLWISLDIFLIITIFPVFFWSLDNFSSRNDQMLRIAWSLLLLISTLVPRVNLVKTNAKNS